MLAKSSSLLIIPLCLFFILVHPPVYADQNVQNIFPPEKKNGDYSRHYAPSRNIDFKHLRLEIKVLMDEQKIEGIAHYQFQPINEHVKYIELDATEMEITQVQCNAPITMTWSYSDNKIHIYFEENLPSDLTMELSVEYQAEPKKGMYFTSSEHVVPRHADQLHTLTEPDLVSNWIPCHDYPNDRLITEMVATVPNKLKTLSNGLLVNSTSDRDWRTDHWKQEIPHVMYLVSLVVGKFDVVKDEWNGIPVEYYVKEGRADDARPSMGKTPAMIEFFSNYFGYPYPYEKYAQVAVRYFHAGGMEHTTATTLFEWAVIDDEARLDTDYDALIAHELAHQWFGDLVTCESWPQLWLNEGFATYSDALWFEHAKGEDAFLDAVMGKMEGYIRASNQYIRPIVENRFQDPYEMFDSHSYPKAAAVLHMLRNRLGDEFFRKSIKHYLHEHAPGLVDTDDFMESIEAVTGHSMQQFFEQWIFQPGHPKLKVSHEWIPLLKQVKINIEQIQNTEDATPNFAFPLEVDLITPNQTITKTFDIENSKETLFVSCDVAPKSIVIDPRLKVLKELEYKKSQDMLLYDLEHGSTIVVRIRAARALGEHQNNRVMNALKQCMYEDSYWTVQQEAVKALGRFHNDETKKILIDACNHPHPKVRRTIVSQLGKFHNDDEVYKSIAERFKNDESIHVIAEAARAIRSIKGEHDFFHLLKSGLERESHHHIIRNTVMNTLIELEEAKVYKYLVKFAKDPYHKNLRTTALRGLGKLADKTGKNKEESLDLLLTFMDSKSDAIQRAVFDGLSALKNEEAIPHLQRIKNDHPDKQIRKHAENAIQEIRKGKKELDAKNATRIDELEKEQDQLQERIKNLEELLNQLKQETKQTEDQN